MQWWLKMTSCFYTSENAKLCFTTVFLWCPFDHMDYFLSQHGYITARPVRCGPKLLVHSYPPAAAVWQWISNFLPHIIIHMVTYPHWYWLQSKLVEGASSGCHLLVWAIAEGKKRTVGPNRKPIKPLLENLARKMVAIVSRPQCVKIRTLIFVGHHDTYSNPSPEHTVWALNVVCVSGWTLHSHISSQEAGIKQSMPMCLT